MIDSPNNLQDAGPGTELQSETEIRLPNGKYISNFLFLFSKCVCVHTHPHTHTYIYYIYVCVYVCIKPGHGNLLK